MIKYCSLNIQRFWEMAGALRSRREERTENGVKNLKGSEAIPQNLFESRNLECLLLMRKACYLRCREYNIQDS